MVLRAVCVQCVCVCVCAWIVYVCTLCVEVCVCVWGGGVECVCVWCVVFVCVVCSICVCMGGLLLCIVYKIRVNGWAQVLDVSVCMHVWFGVGWEVM